MSERIREIKVAEGVRLPAHNTRSYDGYEVSTNQHKYMILIDNSQRCYENWGYFSSEDDP